VFAAGLTELTALPGDFDGSGHVDFPDALALMDCQAGPDMTPTPTPPTTVQQCLDAFDFDGDGDVDMVDAAQFARLYEG